MDKRDYTTDDGRIFQYPHEAGAKAAILADGLLSFAALADTLDAAGVRGLAEYCRGFAIDLGPGDMPTRRAFWLAAAVFLEETLIARRSEAIRDQLDPAAPLLTPEADAAGEAFLDEQWAKLTQDDEPTRAVITRADAGDEAAARELHARSDRDDLEAREWSEEHR